MEEFQELEEQNYKIKCTVDGCKRRFKKELDLKFHLRSDGMKDISHMRAFDELDGTRPYFLLVQAALDDPSQKRITDFFTKKNSS